MKKYIYYVLIIFIMIASISLNYIYNNSLKEQSILIYEYNNSGSLNFPLELVENFNHSYPNITVTTLPISFLKARYFLKYYKPKEALKLLHKSLKNNPYLGISEYELAKFYFLRNLDSSYYYSKIAFNKLPRNNYHTKIYFTTLRKLKKEKELDSAFNAVKNFNQFEQWKDYIFSKLEMNEINRDKLQSLLDSNEYFDRSSDEFITLQTLVNVGFNNFTDYQASIIKAEALFDQDRLIESAVIYDEVSIKNPTEYLLKENAAVAYFKAGMYQAAINYFKFVIDNFKDRKNAKSEFYLGVTYLSVENKFLGCHYLKQASKKNFAGANKVLKNYCKQKN